MTLTLLAPITMEMGQHVRCSATGVCYFDSDGDVKSRQIEFTDEGNGGCWKQTPSFFFGLKHSSILQVTTSTSRTTSIITCFKMPQHVLPSIYSIVIVQSRAPANQIDSSCENRLPPSHSLPSSQESSNRRECKQITLESVQYASSCHVFWNNPIERTHNAR